MLCTERVVLQPWQTGYNRQCISLIFEPVHLKSPQTSVKIMWQYISLMALMAKWLEQASQWHEMYCHDLEVTSSNPGRVELGVHSTSVLSRTWTKNINRSLMADTAPLKWNSWKSMLTWQKRAVYIKPLANNLSHCVSLTCNHSIIKRVSTNLSLLSSPGCRGHIPCPYLTVYFTIFHQRQMT